jgi:peptidoglycan hydrolase-like protein with peptidoglycan-binding domain
VTIYTVDRGQSGYPVWATQRGINALLDPDIAEDGEFGNQTELAVRRFQQYVGLVDDGRFGPKSSAALARRLEDEVSDSLPHGLLRGIVKGESGELIGAVNHSVAGGVDVSYCQRRVYSKDYEDQAVVKRAFDGRYQMTLLGNTLSGRHSAYFGRAGAKTHKRAWQLATLYHNYQYAAEKLSHGLWQTSYSTSPQNWVLDIGATFPDGSPVRTPLDWCNYYIAKMTRFVDDWTP